MEILKLSNSCVNCRSLEDPTNLCKTHDVTVSFENTCDSFANRQEN